MKYWGPITITFRFENNITLCVGNEKDPEWSFRSLNKLQNVFGMSYGMNEY